MTFEDLTLLLDREAKGIARAYQRDRDETAFGDRLDDWLVRGHGLAYRLGRRAGGSPATDAEADEVGRTIKDLESYYSRGFENDLRDGWGNGDADRVHARCRMYLGRVRGTATGGWVDGSPDEAEFHWRLGGTEAHCPDCPELADAGPYRKDSLPTMPGENQTACLFHCDCTLVRTGGDRSFERVELPKREDVRPMAPGSVTTIDPVPRPKDGRKGNDPADAAAIRAYVQDALAAREDAPWIRLGDAGPAFAQELAILGLQAHDVALPAFSIRHVDKRHGNDAKERLHGQRGVKEVDWVKLLGRFAAIRSIQRAVAHTGADQVTVEIQDRVSVVLERMSQPPRWSVVTQWIRK